MSEVQVTAEFLDSLTVEEIEAIEDIVDLSIDEMFDGKTSVRKGKLMRAFGYVLKRREDPDFTIDQAGRLSMSVLMKMLEDAEVAAQVPLSGSSA